MGNILTCVLFWRNEKYQDLENDSGAYKAPVFVEMEDTRTVPYLNFSNMATPSGMVWLQSSRPSRYDPMRGL